MIHKDSRSFLVANSGEAAVHGWGWDLTNTPKGKHRKKGLPVLEFRHREAFCLEICWQPFFMGESCLLGAEVIK